VRVVLQRVTWARVEIDAEEVAAIGPGLLALVGVAAGDDVAMARRLAEKTVRLRLFGDEGRGFERSVLDIGGSLLCVSQFTLLGDVRRGNRPSWSAAAAPEVAAPLVDAYADAAEELGVAVVAGASAR
jgi:D-tyrosyl-tRNA(Tyr) deacylase